MKVTTTATDGVADKGSLLLTFSGGGHTADYSFSSNEKIADLHYSLGVQLSAKQSNKYKIELGGLIGTIVQLAMALGGGDARKQVIRNGGTVEGDLRTLLTPRHQA